MHRGAHIEGILMVPVAQRLNKPENSCPEEAMCLAAMRLASGIPWQVFAQ